MRSQLKLVEHKSLQTDGEMLVPESNDEIVTVHWMYKAFTEQRMTVSHIAALLEQRDILSDFERPSTHGAMRR